MGILGPLVVESAGQPVQIGGARLRSQLTRHAADAGRWVSSGALASALWPDDDAPTDQANALQSLVSRLRRALPQAQLIDSGPAGYRLLLGPDDVDAARFEAAIAQARRDLRAGRTAEGVQELRAALALWRGPALDDVPQLPYVTAWATRLEELRLTATEDRIEADLELGQLAGLVPELEELVAGHPLRERLHGQLILALSRSGRAAEALQAYERVRRVLADELGVDPSPALKAVHLAVLRNDSVASPQLSAIHPERRTNLLPSLTSFVGREDDIVRITDALRRSRLVTLVGTGGAGKTRLSVEVGWQLSDCGTDGIWQAELAPVSDPDGLAAAALGAIGARDSARLDGRPAGGHRDDLSRLVEAIGDRDIVLLLDNCEHVIDAAAKLAEQLLGQCLRLKVLATSREPLGIFGESLWPVQPLITPEGDDLVEMKATAAVQLFVDRGALVHPDFALDEQNAAAVSEICRRLDGLPLAIELAAARLKTLAPQSIAARLQDRFRLLTGGSRTAMPRHQTLRAVVAWSWDLLSDSERRLAERLSVFPGGATVEAAAVVAVPDADGEVLDRLSALADKSLLVAMDAGVPRYRMLETIREFSIERLAERGQVQPVRAAFVQYFLELAETLEPVLRGRDQLAALQQLHDERENLLAAMRFAIDAADAESAVRLGAALSWYWPLLGRHEEAASLLGDALALGQDVPPEPYLIAVVIHAISAAGTGQGLPSAEDLEKITRRAALVDPLTSHPLIALITPALAMLADDRDAVIEAVEGLLAHRDPWAVAMLHLLDVVSAENAGDLVRMREVLPLALHGFKEIGDRWGTGTTIQAMANVLALDGDIAGSVAALREARLLMGELHATDDETFALVRTGILLLQLGQADAARSDIARGLEIARQSGAAHACAYALLGMAMLAQADGDRAAARGWAERALELVEGTISGPPQVLTVILAVLAHLDLLDGDIESARRRLASGWGPILGSRDMPVVSKVMTVVAEAIYATGDAELAARMIGAGERARGGADLGEPDLLELAGTLRAALGAEIYEELLAAGRNLDRPAALGLASDWLGVDSAPFTDVRLNPPEPSA